MNFIQVTEFHGTLVQITLASSRRCLEMTGPHFFSLLEHRIIYLQFMHIHSVNANNALGERAYVSLRFPHLSSNEYIRWLHIAMNYLPQKHIRQELCNEEKSIPTSKIFVNNKEIKR